MRYTLLKQANFEVFALLHERTMYQDEPFNIDSMDEVLYKTRKLRTDD